MFCFAMLCWWAISVFLSIGGKGRGGGGGVVAIGNVHRRAALSLRNTSSFYFLLNLVVLGLHRTGLFLLSLFSIL